ncbi:hypothetical protein CMK12_17325 [Candidatus Poribacteria bacterium]|nr:hypothetical protein [Candidatus Poribacteria bacterium]MCP4260316.1 hypothetical protein [Planctomycetota bacterium]
MYNDTGMRQHRTMTAREEREAKLASCNRRRSVNLLRKSVFVAIIVFIVALLRDGVPAEVSHMSMIACGLILILWSSPVSFSQLESEIVRLSYPISERVYLDVFLCWSMIAWLNVRTNEVSAGSAGFTVVMAVISVFSLFGGVLAIRSGRILANCFRRQEA